MTQYGAQGTPVTVSADPPTAPPVAPAAPSVAAGSGLQFEALTTETEAAPAPEPTLADVLDLNTALEAKIARIARLVPRWEHVAEHTLQRNEYSKGQRDATMGCADDLRKAVEGRE